MSIPRPPLRRSKSKRRIAGVCAGVAERWGWNLSLVRVIWLICTLIPVLPGLPAYLVLWLCVPVE